jgi:hypothetical protein
MAPPITDEEVKTKTILSHKKPISEWTHIQSFDTAKQCESWRDPAVGNRTKGNNAEVDKLTATLAFAAVFRPFD